MKLCFENTAILILNSDNDKLLAILQTKELNQLF